MGGQLAKPHDRWPELFSHPFWVEYPYFLPCAASASFSAFTFISPVSSSMIAPASDQLAQEFGITNETVIALVTSIFVLAYGMLIFPAVLQFALPLFHSTWSIIFGTTE